MEQLQINIKFSKEYLANDTVESPYYTINSEEYSSGEEQQSPVKSYVSINDLPQLS
jgi:hypothetical protein